MWWTLTHLRLLLSQQVQFTLPLQQLLLLPEDELGLQRHKLSQVSVARVARAKEELVPHAQKPTTYGRWDRIGVGRRSGRLVRSRQVLSAFDAQVHPRSSPRVTVVFREDGISRQPDNTGVLGG